MISYVITLPIYWDIIYREKNPGVRVLLTPLTKRTQRC